MFAVAAEELWVREDVAPARANKGGTGECGWQRSEADEDFLEEILIVQRRWRGTSIVVILGYGASRHCGTPQPLAIHTWIDPERAAKKHSNQWTYFFSQCGCKQINVINGHISPVGQSMCDAEYPPTHKEHASSLFPHLTQKHTQALFFCLKYNNKWDGADDLTVGESESEQDP